MTGKADDMGRPLTTTASILAVVLSAALAGCGEEGPSSQASGSRPGRTRVALLLNWFPEAEHGGYFAAQVHGFYAEEGLEVQILAGGPGAAVVPRAATGDVDFGVENADHVLMARAQQAPVVAVMAPIQTHPRCIMVHEESGITSLAELRSLTLAMNAGGAFSHYLRRKVPLDGVEIVPYPGNVARFVTDEDYAQQAYVFSEPFVAKQQGAHPRNLLLSEIGFNPYTSCLLTNDNMIRSRPDVVRRMARASARGWARYLEDPGPTHARIHELNPEMSMEALDYGAEALRDLVLTDEAAAEGVGTMNAARWRDLHDQLVEIELIEPGAVRVEEAYSLEFLAGRP
jgi:NitT/TauT family transport system substrate-binding protein